MTWTPAALDIEADLTVEVDGGADGRSTGRLTGDGQHLRLELDNPQVLAGSADRTMIGALAAGLAAAGVHAEVHGPDGRIATLDPGRTSRIGALLLGSPHVAVEPAAWPLALRSPLLRSSAGRAAIVLAAVAVPVAVVVGIVRARRP